MTTRTTPTAAAVAVSPSMYKRLFALSVCALAFVTSNVSACGYMSSPHCRGCSNIGTPGFHINAPNTRGGLCRGEPASYSTAIPGNTVDIELDITVASPGPCQVYLLDEDLRNPIEIGHRDVCVTAKGIEHWTVPLPADAVGKKVLRWVWTTYAKGSVKSYEQCSDIIVGDVDPNAVAAEDGGFVTTVVPPPLPAEVVPEPYEPAGYPAPAEDKDCD